MQTENQYCNIGLELYLRLNALKGIPGGLVVKNPPAMHEMQKMQVCSLSQEDSLEEGMAIHSSVLAWRIPWTEEPGGPQSIGSQRVGHDLKD